MKGGKNGYRGVGSNDDGAVRNTSADGEPALTERSESVRVSEVQFSFFEGHEDMTLRRSPSTVTERLRIGLMHHLSARVEVLNLARVIIFLSLLGVIPAAIIFLIDLSVHAVTNARETMSVSDGGSLLGFIVYVVSGVVLCLLSTLVCLILSTEAEGSGIPQMKAIMSGFYDKCKPSLSMWALVAKALGLVCAIGGGLPVGWEGPNVHISCIIAHHLSRLPLFRVLRRDRALRLQIMASACSVGLASSFGTPIGGVLYALETTSSFYLVPTFWKSVLATITGALFYDILYKTPLVEALESTSFDQDDYKRSQLVAFALLGCIMGIAGAFFVKCVKFVYDIRKRNYIGGNRFLLVGAIGLISALVSYKTRLFRLDPREAINELFSSNALLNLSWFDVFLLLVIKFPLVVVSIGLPVPAGVFIPCFLLGSAFGRLYGEFLKSIFGSVIVPGGYAVVGAAAFTAGVTRALSCAVVIFEVTGQLQHMVPSLVAVLLAVIVGNSFDRSLYDTLIIMKDLPYMPHMRRDLDPMMTVRQVMDRKVTTVKEVSDIEEVENIIRYDMDDLDALPIVSRGGGLVGSVRRTTLLYQLERAKLERRNHQDHDEDAERNVGQNAGRNMEQEAPIVTIEMDSIEDIGTSDVTATDVLREQSSGDGGAEVEDRSSFKIESDLSPLVVTDKMLLSQLHFMFVMLMPTHALVLNKGRLVGVVRRKDIIFTGSENSH